MIALFQSLLVSVLPFLVVIMTIVVVHELGHFLTAKAFGVAIDRFAVGFGRALLSWKDRSGVEWRIGWIPLGGYVRFAGDTNDASVPDQTNLDALRLRIVAVEGAGAEKRYLQFKPVWQRILVVAAGPAANFLLAIILFAIIYGVYGEDVGSTQVYSIAPGSPAASAGLLPGDRILAMDGKVAHSFQDVAQYVQYRADIKIDFLVDRAGRPLHLAATPRAADVDSPFGGRQAVGHLGMGSRGGVFRRYAPLDAVVMGARKTVDVLQATVFYLGRIVSGQVNPNQLHSFIGIAHASGEITTDAIAAAQAVKVNWLFAVSLGLIQLAGVMSVSVGLLNLLPIPVLDGGHLLFYAYESVVRRPVAAAVQAVGYRVGLALLVSMMLFATWNDLHPLRLFHLSGG